MESARRLAVALVAAAFAGPPASAQSVESELQACVANASGRVRVLPTGATCKARETARLLALAPGPAGCRVVARLTLQGIAGEGPNRSIALFAYAVDVQGPAAGGPAVFSPLEVTKALDAASVALFQAALLGTHLASGRLEVLGAGGVVATAYDLADVLVASVALGGSSPCTSPSPTEDVTLAFASLALAPPN
jgi:hypothetical protein